MKRITFKISIMFLAWIALGLNSSEAKAATKFFEDNENGVLTVTYNNKNNDKMKIAVTKDGKNYYYDLSDGENSLDIPLTMGNGVYQLRICRNISGTKYSIIEYQTYELKLDSEDEVFVNSNVIVNYEQEDKAIKKAASLTQNSEKQSDKVEKIYDYVVKNYLYDYEKKKNLQSGYIPDIEIVYKNKKGICYDISSLMAAMLRSQGIKAKVITGYAKNVTAYHAWNAIFEEKEKKWITVDATSDLCKYAAGKKYEMKKSDKDYSDVVYQY